MKLRISSDGTPHGTHVYGYNKQGEMVLVEGVTRVEWAVGLDNRAIAKVTVIGVPLEADTDLAPSDLTIGKHDDFPF